VKWTKTESFRLTFAESKVRTQRNAQRKFSLSDWLSLNQKRHFTFWIKFGLILKFGLRERLIQKVKSPNVNQSHSGPSTSLVPRSSKYVESYTLSTQYCSSSPNVSAFWDAAFDFASSPRTPSVRSWSSRPTEELSSLNAVSNQRVRSRIRNIESRSRSRSRSNSRSLSAEIQRTTSSDAVYHLTHIHHSCNLYTLERCNPWPHVANRHMSISQLLSTCR